VAILAVTKVDAELIGLITDLILWQGATLWSAFTASFTGYTVARTSDKKTAKGIMPGRLLKLAAKDRHKDFLRQKKITFKGRKYMPSIKAWLIQNRDKYTDRKQYINDCIKDSIFPVTFLTKYIIIQAHRPNAHMPNPISLINVRILIHSIANAPYFWFLTLDI